VTTVKRLVWQGLGADPRMEIAHVELDGPALRARGTQIGADYELRYELSSAELTVEIVGGARRSVHLADADFFDLGLSPLFNTLPVLRDGLLRAQHPRDYSMRWVSVPELTVQPSEQRYEPIGGNRIRFSAGAFVVDLLFDDDGFVTEYPGLATRVS
jgi:hypothetical protein